MSEEIGISQNEINGISNIRTRAELPKYHENEIKLEALATLVELGSLIPINQIQTFHGRVGAGDENWAVEPTYVNHGNTTGNANVNKRSTLYTSDHETAKDFAQKRALNAFIRSHLQELEERVKNYTNEEKEAWLSRLNEEEASSPFRSTYKLSDLNEGSFGYFSHVRKEVESLAKRIFTESLENDSGSTMDVRPEIHEIVTRNPDAMILDLGFKPERLSNDDRTRYQHALQALAIPITEGSPISFESRDEIAKFFKVMSRLQRNVVMQHDIAVFAVEAGISEKTALQLASAYNSRQIALSNPAFLADRLLRYPSEIFTDIIDADGTKLEIPINLEYAERYMRESHIIAAKQTIDSVTVNRNITSVSFFDLDQIGTREQIETQKSAMLEKMDGLRKAFPHPPESQNTADAQMLFKRLNNPYVKPEILLEAAKQIEEFKVIYESDAGNWEGFTLEEHTETVLRNFDENYADIIPVEYLVPLRLAILAHDLGKPIAVSRGEKYRQKDYNTFYAKSFFNSIGLDSHLKEFLTAIVTDGSDLAFKLQKQPGDPTLHREMRIFAEDVLQVYLQKDNISDSEIKSFTEMCKIFQLCDGGAYTSMAITRRKGKGHFRNPPSFNTSFKEPNGPGKRDIRYISSD